MRLFSLIVFFALITPLPLFADPDNFADLVAIFLDIIEVLVVAVFGLSLIVFLWGLARAWILGAGDEKQIEKGKNTALVGIIVFVIMFSIWGIINLLRDTLFNF